MRAWPRILKRHVDYHNGIPVTRKAGYMRFAFDQSIAAIRSQQGIFDDAEVSRAIQEQQGTFEISLLLGAQSSRRVHEMRAELIDGYDSATRMSVRIPLLRPLPASQICLELPSTMEALCSGNEKVFQLHLQTPFAYGTAVMVDFMPNNHLRRVQNKLLAAFGIIDDMGDPTAYLLTPALSLVAFGLKKWALPGCVDHAKREIENGIQPLTVIGLTFRYMPAMRGQSRWDPYRISRAWVDFHFALSSKVRSQDGSVAQRTNLDDSALGFRRLELDRDQSEHSKQAHAQAERMVKKQIAPRRWVFDGALY
ncbi:hypothetical protein PZA11_005573 [Diplocarpon coronariae]|nr:hypothetical protein JHW43_000087 [Diplocarpon mali]